MYALRSLGLALLAAALRASAGPLAKRAVAYYNPADHGGSMLTQVENSTLGEPLNVRASRFILVWARVDALVAGHHLGLELARRAHPRWGDQLCAGDRLVSPSLRSFMVCTRALTQIVSSSTECLGIHLGAPQAANLGDGNGYVNQTIELREDYGDASVGTCLESAIGGNHFR